MDRELVRKVASLAKLRLTEQEEAACARDLETVLDAFKTLADAPVTKTAPTVHPVPVLNRTRDDIVEPSLSQEEALANAKNKQDGYFVGPRVV